MSPTPAAGWARRHLALIVCAAGAIAVNAMALTLADRRPRSTYRRRASSRAAGAAAADRAARPSSRASIPLRRSGSAPVTVAVVVPEQPSRPSFEPWRDSVTPTASSTRFASTGSARSTRRPSRKATGLSTWTRSTHSGSTASPSRYWSATAATSFPASCSTARPAAGRTCQPASSGCGRPTCDRPPAAAPSRQRPSRRAVRRQWRVGVPSAPDRRRRRFPGGQTVHRAAPAVDRNLPWRALQWRRNRPKSLE